MGGEGKERVMRKPIPRSSSSPEQPPASAERRSREFAATATTSRSLPAGRTASKRAEGGRGARAAGAGDPDRRRRLEGGRAAADRIERELGPIDVWVNNAFAGIFSRFMDVTPEEYERVTEVTYLGQVNGTRAALKRMLPRDRGQDRAGRLGARLSRHPAAVGLLRRQARDPGLHRFAPLRAARTRRPT